MAFTESAKKVPVQLTRIRFQLGNIITLALSTRRTNRHSVTLAPTPGLLSCGVGCLYVWRV